jgi:hypothetical protein
LFSDLRTIKLAFHQGGGAVINRAQILKDWIEKGGRKQSWVAQQVQRSPQWLNYVLRGKRPMSDKLARTLEDKLGISLFDEGQAIGKGRKRKTGLKIKKRGKDEQIHDSSH